MIIHFAGSLEEAKAKGVNARSGKSGDSTYYLYDTHVGLCVAEYERNSYSDSDFYMIVWEPDEKVFKSIQFATTRAWSYPALASCVDAPPELMEKYKKHCREMQEYYAEKRRKAEEERIAKMATKGKSVKVISGRKHKGKSGKVFWAGQTNFGKRVGVEQEDGERFFVPEKYVEVTINA